MEIEVTGHQMEITPSLRSLVEDNLDHIKHHFENIISAHVVLETSKKRHIAKGHLLVPGRTLDAKAETEDMYKSIDQLAKKLLAEVDKYKGKQQSHQS